MRLLHVIQRYYPFSGGSERYFQALSERLAADGAEVDVLTTDAWDLEYFWDPRRERVQNGPGEHRGVRIHRCAVQHLPIPRLTHRGLRRLMAETAPLRIPGQIPLLNFAGRFGPWVPSLRSAMAAFRGRVDAVHSANVAFESMMAEADRFARRAGIPHLVTPFLHLGEGDRSKVRRYYTMPHQLALVRRADAVMVLTSIEADYLARHGVAPERLHVVGYGLDVSMATGGDAARARRDLSIDGPMVLALGAAAYDKGTVHLVDAVSTLNRSGHEVTLVVAGPVTTEFQRIIGSLSERDRGWVKVLGFVSDNQRRDLLAAADVLALPSRTESFGIVFLEAWANGKPVIGARAGAIPAVVDDGIDGLLVPFGDVTSLAEAVRSLVDNPAMADRMGQAGRSKVVDEDSWYRRVRAVYETVLGRE